MSKPAIIPDFDPAMDDLHLHSVAGAGSERAPVYWSRKVSGWAVSSFAGAEKVLGDQGFSADRIQPFYRRASDKEREVLAEVMRYIGLWLVFRDPPEHTRLRRLMASAFSNKTVQSLRPGVERVARQLVSDLEGRDRIEFISEFSMHFPAMVIMDMLGVPYEMFGDVKHWSDDMTMFVHAPRGVPDKYERARAGVVAMAKYFGELIAERRRRPSDDLLSDLIAARDNQSTLTDDELVSVAMLILFAGHETTTNMLANSILTLSLNQDAQRWLRAHPDAMLQSVEELLRFCGPIRATGRLVRTPQTLEGAELSEGDRIFAILSTANRDSAMFENPDRLDFERTPNRHMAFGRGAHFCIGSSLVRLETEIALKELLATYRSIDLDCRESEISWQDSLVSHALTRLPVALAR